MVELNNESDKLSDESLRGQDTARSLAGAEISSVAKQIRQLRTENEYLRKEKNEIEKKSQEKVGILENKLTIIQEQLDEAKQKTFKADELVRKEKKEKSDLIDELQNEKEEKNRAILREKELDERYIVKEKEKRKAEQQLRHESEEKNEAIEKAEEAERSKTVEIENRRKLKKEKDFIVWENEKLMKENQRLKNELEIEQNLVCEFETKYNDEIKEKEKQIIIAKEKDIQRQKAEILQYEEQKQKENAIRQIEVAQKTIDEQAEKLISTQNNNEQKDELIIQIKKEKEKVEIKEKEEERKRKEAESEKDKVLEENWILKIEISRKQYQFARIKEKYGEENVGKEIQLIESQQREKDEKIQQLGESNRIKDEQLRQKDEELQHENSEKQKIQTELKQANEQKEREKTEKEKKDEEINVLKTENSKLKEENEKYLIKSNQKSPKDLPIEFHNPDSSTIDFTNIDGIMKKITNKQRKHNTVSLSQVMENGIYSMEIKQTSGESGGFAIGIVRDSCNIPAGAYQDNNPYNQHMAVYCGNRWSSGQLRYKGNSTSGNIDFGINQIIRQEFDSEKGSVIFFVDGIQQPNYFIGIKEKICFYYENVTCEIQSLKKHTNPTSIHVSNEKSIQW